MVDEVEGAAAPAQGGDDATDGWVPESVAAGYDDGPMCVLEINRLREVRLEEWADQDFEQELAPPRTMYDVSEDRAV